MTEIDHVEARVAIYDVMAQYVHALDDRDYDALDCVFTPDAMFDLTVASATRGRWSSAGSPATCTSSSTTST